MQTDMFEQDLFPPDRKVSVLEIALHMLHVIGMMESLEWHHLRPPSGGESSYHRAAELYSLLMTLADES